MPTRDELRRDVLDAMDYNDGFSDPGSATALLDALLAAERAYERQRCLTVVDIEAKRYAVGGAVFMAAGSMLNRIKALP